MKTGAPDPRWRVVVETPSRLGESPLWHPTEQRLYWVDIDGRQLCRLEPNSGRRDTWDFDSEPSAVAPMPDGGLLLALRSGLWRFDPASGARRKLADAPYKPALQRFNDGKCDARGRFWVGTMCDPLQPPRGAMHCYAGRKLALRFDGLSISNGLAWSLDGRTMYWADTLTNVVQAFDFDPDSGELSRRRDFVRFPTDPDGDDWLGRPDGAAVDCEGCYWLAMYEGQRVLRLSPRGEILQQLLLPVRCPTMPAFGGADLKTLYVTTAREQRPAAELAAQPLAGCVFAMAVDVPGLPANFASP